MVFVTLFEIFNSFSKFFFFTQSPWNSNKEFSQEVNCEPIWFISLYGVWKNIMKTFNPFLPSVAFHIGTSHLICSVNQISGFYMKYNTGLKWVKISINKNWIWWEAYSEPCQTLTLSWRRSISCRNLSISLLFKSMD